MPETSPQPDKPPQPAQRWKRAAAASLLLLAGGAIVNIAVAWGIAFNWPSLPYAAPSANPSDTILQGWLVTWQQEEEAETKWIKRNLPPNQHLAARFSTSGLGADIEKFLGVGSLFSASGVSDFHAEYISVGWPARALAGGRWVAEDWRPSAGFPTLTDPVESKGLVTAFLVQDSGWLRTIPYAPDWPGFIINTLFYAMLLWLLFFAPFAGRRMLRRRRAFRGLCEKCAYPIGVSPVCTECGAAVARRSEK